MIASHSRRCSHFICLLILALLIVANAQVYPSYESIFVNDYAGVISTFDENRIRGELERLKTQRDVEMTVLTINSYKAFGTGETSIEAFATNLFNTWGIGNPERNDGVLILVAVDDREMRIELGRGYTPPDDVTAKNVIENQMLPAFRQDDYGGGILRGIDALIAELYPNFPRTNTAPTTSPSANQVTPRPAPLPRPTRYTTPFFSQPAGLLTSLAALVVALGGGAIAVRRARRFRARDCHNCKHSLTRLDELDDDVYLDSGQQTEEVLKSVDYDIWHCANCNEYELNPFPTLFSGYKSCPECGYRTLLVSDHVLVAPTCHSGGITDIREACQFDKCSYHHTYTMHTPQRNCDDSSSSFTSSSSSSSSFSGGSSSGGGASGKW